MSLVSSGEWYPLQEQFGMLAMVVASILVAILSIFIALPLALGLAVWLRFYANNKLRSCYLMVLEVLAAIPSVVYGLWGLLVVVPLLVNYSPPGASLLAGVLMLSLVLLPILVIVIDLSLASASQRFELAAKSLRISMRGFVTKIAIPQALPAIISGASLQTGRAFGETIIVLMVCGNVVQFPDSLFSPIRTLTANIALEMGYALDLHRAVLFTGGLILLGLASLTIVIALKLHPLSYVRH